LVSAGAVYLAGRRDLGASTFGDNDSAEARNYLLNTPLGVSLRLTSRSIMSWVLALTAAGMYFGVLTKPAAQAFQSSAGLENVLNRVTQAAQYSGATIYLGIVFFLLMLVVMIYAAGAVGAMRFDEAEGYLDNLLVRPVSRIQWLFNRTSLIVGAVIVMCVLASLGTYATTYGQISGLTISILIKSGLNMVAPAIFVLGVGILGLGFWPRWSSMLAYAIIGWSFLIEMLSSGLSLNKWLLDTSLLHHIALSPATGINWQTNEIIIGLGLILCLIGALRFNSRDLAYE
jgi:ABC-2 type transport system permease protein